jgi:hypothetical protein
VDSGCDLITVREIARAGSAVQPAAPAYASVELIETAGVSPESVEVADGPQYVSLAGRGEGLLVRPEW